MATISFDEFVKQAGGKPEQVKTLGVNANPVVSQETQTPNYLQRVGGDIKQSLLSAKSDIVGNDSRNSLSKGLSAVSNVASAVAAPIAELPILKQIGETINKGISMGGEELSKLYTPEFQKQLADLSPEDFDMVTQPLKDLANTGNIANTILMAKGAEKASNVVKETATKGVDTISSIANNAQKYPKQIIDNLTDKITTIDPHTKNILKTASIEKFDNYVKTGQEAINNPRALTPLEQAGEKVNNQILPNIKEDLNRIGSQKAKSLESVKNTKIPDGAIDVIKFVQDNTNKLKLTTEERKLVNSIQDELGKLGKNPTLGSADKTVDLLQNTLYEKTKGLAIPVTSRVESIINQAIGKLNSNVKKSASKVLGSDEYSALNDAYATKIELFNKLNKAIGEDAQKGGSLFKKFFSPQDSGTKKLFSDIKEQYGVDLAEDATLAKFVMDSLGDVRSKSLLEEIPTSKTGLVTKGLQKIEKSLTKPIPKARRIIEKRPQ